MLAVAKDAHQALQFELDVRVLEVEQRLRREWSVRCVDGKRWLESVPGYIFHSSGQGRLQGRLHLILRWRGLPRRVPTRGCHRYEQSCNQDALLCQRHRPVRYRRMQRCVTWVTCGSSPRAAPWQTSTRSCPCPWAALCPNAILCHDRSIEVWRAGHREELH